jgi:hypothetical protein
MKNQLNNYRIRSHEYQEAGKFSDSLIISINKVKINEIKKSNQVLLERLLDISKGKGVSRKFAFDIL